MRIAPTRPGTGPPVRRNDRAAGPGGAGFAGLLAAPGAAAGAGPAASGGLAALLAAQEAGDALSAPAGRDESRRRAVRRGHDLLDRLDGLHRDLLLGRVPAQRLEALSAALAADSTPPDDPELDAILGQVELRVAVELAKLSRRPDGI